MGIVYERTRKYQVIVNRNIKIFDSLFGFITIKIRTRDKCNFDELLNAQINKELTASYFYYSLGQKFKFYTNVRPNLAKLFEERAAEERGHAEKLVNFQLERGVVPQFFDIKYQAGKIHDNISMLESLKISLAMEIILTDELKTVKIISLEFI